MDLNIAIVGAGLAGTMMAALLDKLGMKVTLYEKRTGDDSVSDSVLGQSASASKRSINLALSYRGIKALREVGLLDQALEKAVRMPKRVIHAYDGSITTQAYGADDESLWSVSRQGLGELLLASLNQDRMKLKMGYSLIHVDVHTGHCKFSYTDTQGQLAYEEADYDLIIGADGAYSKVRENMLRQGQINFSRQYIRHGYKELSIPASPITKDFQLKEPEGLHIWPGPKGEFMLIALPNDDRSFTATLFAPFDTVFDPLAKADDVKQRKEKIFAWFAQYFPTVLPYIPSLVDDYLTNPTSPLVTLRVAPWQVGKVLLMGDAAHAVVPFYGQGMNAAFEDAFEFYRILQAILQQQQASLQQQTNSLPSQLTSVSTKVDLMKCLSSSMQSFSESRQPACNALADLCLEHYYDMAANTASPWYLAVRKVESMVLHYFPRKISNHFRSLYRMVSFTDIPYHTAIVLSAKQDRWLSWSIAAGLTAITSLAVVGGARMMNIGGKGGERMFVGVGVGEKWKGWLVDGMKLVVGKSSK